MHTSSSTAADGKTSEIAATLWATRENAGKTDLRPVVHACTPKVHEKKVKRKLAKSKKEKGELY